MVGIRIFLWSILLISLFSCREQAKEILKDKLPFSESKLKEQDSRTVYQLATILHPAYLIDSVYQPLFHYHFNKGNIKTADTLLNDFHKLRSEESLPAAFIFLNTGRLFLLSGKPDSAAYFLNQAANIYQQEKNTKQLAELDLLFSEMEQERGDYVKSINYLLEAVNKYSIIGDSLGLNDAKLSQCANFYRLGRCEEMNNLAKQILPWYQKQGDTLALGNIFNILALHFECKKQYDSSLVYHKLALNHRIAGNYSHEIGQSYNNIAVILNGQNQAQAAAEYLQKAIKILNETGDSATASISKSILGNCYSKIDRLPESIRLYEEVRETQSKYGLLGPAAINHERMAQAYKSLGQHEKALNSYLQSRVLRDSAQKINSQTEINLLSQKFANAQKEYQIQLLENQKNRSQIWLLSLSLFSLFVIAFSAFYVLRARVKQRFLDHEHELSLAQQKADAKKLALAEMDLQHSKILLEETTRNLQQKSQLAETLRTTIDEISEKNKRSPISPEEIQQQLTALFGMKILTDEDWENFRNSFEKVNPGLISLFKNRYPDITDAELRLVLLIKMGLRSRDTAAMLGISPDSVSKTRYRLRRRLNLHEQDNLEDFISHAH